MNEAHLQQLAELLESRAGLDLGSGGMASTLQRVVQERLELNQRSMEGYFERLRAPASVELEHLLEAMTVVYTWFFRDPGQFLILEHLFRAWPRDTIMKIWVAACATGEEADSVALVANQCGIQGQILATDLNSKALRHASAAKYSSASLRAVDATMLARYIGAGTEPFEVPEPVRTMVRFQVANLVDGPPSAPAGAGWDLILCRNVLIYFCKEQARRSLSMMARALAPGGHLILEATESILEGVETLANVGIAGRSVLQRPAQAIRRSSSSPGRSEYSDLPRTTGMPRPAACSVVSCSPAAQNGAPLRSPYPLRPVEEFTVVGGSESTMASGAATMNTPSTLFPDLAPVHRSLERAATAVQQLAENSRPRQAARTEADAPPERVSSSSEPRAAFACLLPPKGPQQEPEASGTAALPLRSARSLSECMTRGHSQLETGDVVAARESYSQAISLDPTCAEAVMFAGITHYLEGDLDVALGRLRAALLLDGTLWIASYYQALCYESMGYADDATRSYALVLRVAARHPNIANAPAFIQTWFTDVLAVARRRAQSSQSARSLGDTGS